MKDLDEIYADTWIRRDANLNGISYDEYLKSEHWLNTKRKAKKRPNYQKCEFCDCQDVELHHTSYKHIFDKRELVNVIALCRIHHQEVHDYAKEHSLSVRLATNALRKVYKPHFWEKNRVNETIS